MTQHTSLTPERWAAFNRDQQLLMIANEMNRASGLFSDPADRGRLAHCYERVLRLTDLTMQVQPSRTLRRELLLWRDLAAEIYLEPDAARHRALFRALLLLTPECARQIPYVLGPPGSGSGLRMPPGEGSAPPGSGAAGVGQGGGC